jgi:hypothetical protein
MHQLKLSLHPAGSARIIMGRVGIEPTTLGLKGVYPISADLGLACKSTSLLRIEVATISAGLGPSSCHFVATLRGPATAI